MKDISMTAQEKVIAVPARDDCITADAFRQTMRALAGTVTVISTENDGKLYGFTATAVCSVCAEPATLLIAVNRSARTHAHITKKSGFAVNILGEGQDDVAAHFSGKGDDQFAGVEHRITERGIPVLAGVAAHLDCVVDQVYEVGTHTLFIGRVVDAGASDTRPLMYHDAKYCRLTAIS